MASNSVDDDDFVDANNDTEEEKMFEDERNRRRKETLIILESGDAIDYNALSSVAKGKPLLLDDDHTYLRARAWKALVGVSINQPDPFTDWNELYDLPNQDEVREKCKEIVDALGNCPADRMALIAQLESIITLFCKQRKIAYRADNGWASILQLLCTLQYDKKDMYLVFDKIVTKYIPEGCRPCDSETLDLFRLLLLYHDAALCSFLDTRRISPDLYAKKWFNSLFAAVCNVQTTLELCDIYFQLGDPFHIFFIALVMLEHSREALFEMNTTGAMDNVVDFLISLPQQIKNTDLIDLSQLSAYYSSLTPKTFRRDYHGPLFGTNLLLDEFAEGSIHSLLCLPVSIPELLNANKIRLTDRDTQDHKYLVIDCRSKELFKGGHLHGAYNFDASLIVNDPSAYEEHERDLLIYKDNGPWVLHHMCFMGSGLPDDDQYMNMVISRMLKNQRVHVSIAKGGYPALHEMLRETLNKDMKSHTVRACQVCAAHRRSSEIEKGLFSEITAAAKNLDLESKAVKAGDGLLSKFKSAFTTAQPKLNEFKNKAIDYIVGEDDDFEPTLDRPSTSFSSTKQCHVTPKERHMGKAYRGVPSVFAIDDEDDIDEAEDRTLTPNNNLEQKRVSLSNVSVSSPTNVSPVRIAKVNYERWAEDNMVTDCFEARHVEATTKTMTKCRVAIANSYLYILTLLSADVKSNERNDDGELKNDYEILAKRPLAAIHKITSKKNLPELLTIKYGYEMANGSYKVTCVDRFILDKSGDLAKAIKTSVMMMRQSDEAEL